MKPIKLIVKGLNSFEDEQTVDFDKLSAQGFFGIFGPTGSGKSTVLDGITLALYGDESRKSADFINVNCDKAYVKFWFQISAYPVERYLVEREFKRDTKSGAPRTGKCKLVFLGGPEGSDEANPEVLEDTVGGVTKGCMEIIGLTKEDFTRTVVLPQGKFSEFLKMEGKPRRDMLERLFNLQEYGDQLRSKLYRQLDGVKSTKLKLEGELIGIGPVDSKDLQEAQARVSKLDQEILSLDQDVKLIKVQLDEQEALKILTTDWLSQKLAYEGLLEKQDEIKEQKNAVLLHQRASGVIDLIDLEAANRDQEHHLAQSQVIAQTLHVQAIGLLATGQLDYKAALEAYNEKGPQIALELHRLGEASLELMQYEGVQNQAQGLKQAAFEANEGVSNLNRQISDQGQKALVIKQQVLQLQEERKALTMDAHLKEAIRRGADIQRRILDLEPRIDQWLSWQAQNRQHIEGVQAQLDQTLAEKDGLDQDLQRLHDQGVNLNLQGQEGASELDFDKGQMLYNQALSDLDILEGALALIQDYTEKEGQFTSRQIETNLEIEEARKEIQALKGEIDGQHAQTMALQLRHHLIEGQPCPVCSELYDPHKKRGRLAQHIEYQGLEALQNQLSLKEQKLKDLEQIQASCNAQLTQLAFQKNQVQKEVEVQEKKLVDYLDPSLMQQANLLDQVRGHIEALLVDNAHRRTLFLEQEEGRRQLDDQKRQLQAQIIKCEANIALYKSQLDQLNQTHVQRQQMADADLLAIHQLKEQMGNLAKVFEADDYGLLEGQLNEKEKRISAIEGQLDSLQLESGHIDAHISELKEALLRATDAYKDLTSQLKGLEQQMTLIEDRIFRLLSASLAEDHVDDPRDHNKIDSNLKNAILEGQTSLQNELYHLESSRNLAEKALSEAQENLDQASKKLAAQEQSLVELKERLTSLTMKVDERLKDLQFDNRDQARSAVLPASHLEVLIQEVEAYEKQLNATQKAYEALTQKRANRDFDLEAYQATKAKWLQGTDLLKVQGEQLVLSRQEVQYIEQRLQVFEKTLAALSQTQHQLALLKDLEGVFKGNRFVEFVAQERLKYVSAEATHLLLEITGGNYGIDLGEDGRFLMVDNKNGGQLREASTLSGGETFLASLALALALSSEIQLKGTAPLELFFLDEGFGTLDDQLIDVLMTALERIHHDKLKIGIISHVDAVKARVPIKLIVTPATAGMGGSQVHMEYN